MRAALTILGVAIGVTVVMVIGALISGFNKGISDMLGSLGPKTFWVGRYWGGQDEDPEDPDPWRRRPPVTIAEARRLEELPTIAFVVVDENTLADINFEGHTLSAINVRGRDADWPMIEGGHIHPGRSFSHLEDAANSHVAVVNTKLAENLFGQRDAIARRIKIGGVPYDVVGVYDPPPRLFGDGDRPEVMIPHGTRSEEHTSELQSRLHLVCRLLLEKQKHAGADPGRAGRRRGRSDPATDLPVQLRRGAPVDPRRLRFTDGDLRRPSPHPEGEAGPSV